MSWRLRPFWREAADLQQMPCSATGTDTRSLRVRVVGRRAIGIFKAFSLLDRGRAVEQQELAHARGLLAPGWMPQSEVSNLVQPLRQDVLEEPAHEFLPRHAAGPPLVRSALLVADRHRPLVKTDDAGVGNGDAKDVASKVLQHAFRPRPTACIG